MMGDTCTSGRAIPEISSTLHNPCGKRLIIVGRTDKGTPVTACPWCDRATEFPSVVNRHG